MAVLWGDCRATNSSCICYYSSDYILSVQFFYIIFIDFYVYVLCMYCALCAE